MFMKPDADPAQSPAISAVTDQYELCERYRAPAPPERTMLATAGLAAREPITKNTAARSNPRRATPQRPTRLPYERESTSLIAPPDKLQATMASGGRVLYRALAFKSIPRTLAR